MEAEPPRSGVGDARKGVAVSAQHCGGAAGEGFLQANLQLKLEAI